MPLMPGAQEVAHNCFTFAVLCCKNSPQVLEGGELEEGDSLGSECPLRPLPGLRLCIQNIGEQGDRGVNPPPPPHPPVRTILTGSPSQNTYHGSSAW